jgi:hypothetical protein
MENQRESGAGAMLNRTLIHVARNRPGEKRWHARKCTGGAKEKVVCPQLNHFTAEHQKQIDDVYSM